MGTVIFGLIAFLNFTEVFTGIHKVFFFWDSKNLEKGIGRTVTSSIWCFSAGWLKKEGAVMVYWRRVAGDGGRCLTMIFNILFMVMMKSSWLLKFILCFASTVGRLSASVVYKATGL